MEEVDDTGQPRISCRCVCTEKIKCDTVQRKACLCARGYEEVNNQVKSNSVRCQKESLRLLLCIRSAQQWTFHSMDIESAYLQGVPLDREHYMTPPTKESNTENIWLLKKCTYGLSDAGRHWYLKVVGELKILGATHLILDQAVFIWHNSNGNLCGIMAMHVDNFIYGGTPTFINTVISQL